MLEQWVVFLTLLFALILFVWDKLRYDVVALLSLLIVAGFGILDVEETFAGFGHSAVITVAAVLVMSKGLMNSGVIHEFGSIISRIGERPTIQVAVLSLLVSLFSAFMNNIGALAILMPVAIQLARKTGQRLSRLLMPLAFGSLLGGMITLVGTPPNIIISSFRLEASGEPFHMFDFAPVGIAATLAGILFMALLGWRFIPIRQGESRPEESFHIEDYLTEVQILSESPLVGRTIREIHDVAKGEIVIVGILRDTEKIPAPSPLEVLQQGDILIIEANSEALQTFIEKGKVKLIPDTKVKKMKFFGRDVALMEAVVNQDSLMENRNAKELDLRWRYKVNLLAVSRRGEKRFSRLGDFRFRSGDVLLLQGTRSSLQEMMTDLGCLPLPERGIRIGVPKRLLVTVSIFLTALVLVTTGIMHVSLAFTAGAVAMTLFGVLSLKEAYQAIDWPIIILLGAMLPLGTALEKTGGTALIADHVLALSGQLAPEWLVLIIMISTLMLSNVINNAAAAVLLAPIAIQIATSLQLSVDPFLMAVAIGSSTSFMTPIAHQSNVLVMGPGGYRFSDYFRLGFPLTVVVVIISIPVILWVWPLH